MLCLQPQAQHMLRARGERDQKLGSVLIPYVSGTWSRWQGLSPAHSGLPSLFAEPLSVEGAI